MRKKVIINVVYYAVLTALACIFLLPFFVMFSKSLMEYTEIREIPARLFPRVAQFVN